MEYSNDGTNWTVLKTVSKVGRRHSQWHWKKADRPKHRFYRMHGDNKQACYLAEVRYKGKIMSDNETPEEPGTLTCPTKLHLGSFTKTLTKTVKYKNSMTAVIKSVEPCYGNVKGGETITFKGENIPLPDSARTLADYNVVIDGVRCDATSVTATAIQCTTGPRTAFVESTLSVGINGLGNAATGGVSFRYVSYWSDVSTWGMETLPEEGPNTPTSL